ncbi:hypothetical protein GCM10023347_27590 [Streptomyces chumphonensis]|uniref:Uncharacterized protein n=1 Tax=Streptomyces chumphonensis TaxID=1214925 RepID=A0A927IDD9_9ACTN|nr:hypothetical protein [Streptomyces chumphonensis]MBD3932564.1 hypothetical protein [Streptomyces chumphonensis]
MPSDRNAPPRAPFLQTPDALIDDVTLTDAAVRLLQAMVKLPPRNARNSDAVARTLRMGKDKTNAARKGLRAHGHWHARKRQNREGHIRDQRLASLTPLRTPDAVAAGWAAAEEAARLGKDTDRSRRLGVRILNAAEWYGPRAAARPHPTEPAVVEPAAGTPAARPTRRRPPAGDKTAGHQTPLPLPDGVTALTGPLARYAEQAARTLTLIGRADPRFALPTPDVAQLAHLAGQYLLRGRRSDAIRAAIVQGPPPEGVHHPAAYVRARLLRYLPPLPDVRDLAPARPAEPPPHTAPADAPPPVRPQGPAHLIRQGHGWRAALRAAAPPPG